MAHDLVSGGISDRRPAIENCDEGIGAVSDPVEQITLFSCLFPTCSGQHFQLIG